MTPPRSPGPAVIAAVGLVVLLLGVWPNHWFKSSPLRAPDDSSRSAYDDDADDRLGSIKFEFGLHEISSCAMGACSSTDYEALTAQLGMLGEDETDDGGRAQLRKFVWAGRVTFYCGMIGGLCLLGAVLMWAMRQRLPFSLPAVGGALAVVTAIGGTIAFFIQPVVPGLGKYVEIQLEPSLGYPLTLIGAAVAALGAFQLHKEERGFAPFGSGGQAYAQPYYGQPPYPGHPYQPPPMTGPTMQISPACPRCTAPTIFVVEHQRYFCSACRAYL